MQTQQQGLPAARGTVEAGRVDVDERDPPPGERPLNEPVHEPRLEPRRHNGKLECACGRAVLFGEQPRELRLPRRLRSREQFECPLPVRGCGMDLLYVTALR